MDKGRISRLFATEVFQDSLAAEKDFAAFNGELAEACAMLAEGDKAGRAWCKANGYGGYTSYASLDDLPTRATVFAELRRRINRRAKAFAEALAFDLGPKGRLVMDSLWVNVLKPGAAHSGHVHPLSVLSGTYYVTTPPGAGALRLEDPRLGLMMAAPPRRADAADEQKRFVTLTPAEGALVLWESWLRHEVTPGQARSARVSLSFNYAWR
jgi:uncharacterized protein (TIGR02466 family)